MKKMKREIGNLKLAVFALLFALCPLRGAAATNVYLDFTWQQINSNLARVVSSATAWDIAVTWGDHALAGYATGTPIYVESDPAWHSGTGALWSAISAVSPEGYAAVSNAAVTAYEWGNHAAAGYATTAQVAVVESSIGNLQSAMSTVSNAALSAVQRIVLNGTTNTPSSGTVDLGTISGGTVTNVDVFTPNAIRLLTVFPEVASAGTAAANGSYTDSGTTADGKPVYTFADFKIRYYTSTGKWQIENTAGSTTYYYQTTAQAVPWTGTWSTAAGTAPAPEVTAVTNTVADLNAVADSAAEAVKTIVLNGVTNAPANGVVDLGSISAGDPTNIWIDAQSGGVAVYAEFEGNLSDGFMLSGSAFANVNGDYIPSGNLYTNVATGAYFVKESWDTWSIYEGGNNRHWQDMPGYNPWDEEGAWSVTTLVFTASSSTGTWDLTNSLQWVSAPTGSAEAGRPGQYSISDDTNRFFYWYSPTAVLDTTTGIWLRIEGSTF